MSRPGPAPFGQTGRYGGASLQEALGLFRAGFTSSGLAMVLAGPDDRILAVNPAFAQLLGRSEAELQQLTITQITHPDDVAATLVGRGALVQGTSSLYLAEKHYIRPDGTPIPVLVDAVRIEAEDGTLLCTLAHAQDLTARRAAERQALRRAAQLELLRTVALAANAADEPGPVQQIALEQMCELTGWAGGRVLEQRGGRWEPGAVHVGSGRTVRLLQLAAAQLGAPDGTPLAVRLASGGAAGCRTAAPEPGTADADDPVLVVGVPVQIGDELVCVLELLGADVQQVPSAALLAVLTDVGVQLGRVVERQRNRAAIAASEARQRAVIEYAADAFVESDRTGAITAWNPRAEQMFGWSALEVLGRPIGEVLIPQRLRAAHEAGLARVLATGESRLHGRRVQLAALHRNGHEFPVQLSLSVRPVADTWVVQAFLHDVTEQDTALRELAAKNDLLDAVLDSLTDGVVACGPDGSLTLVNRSHLDLWGLPEDPRPPQEWVQDLQLFEADGVTPMPVERTPLHRALRGEAVTEEDVVLGRPGQYRSLRCTATPLVADDGRSLGAVCALHDVTEQVAAERSLARLRSTDPVSGLPNRAVLLDRLASLPARRRHTLVQLHAEDLSSVMAVEGTEVGEALVCEVAKRLERVVRADDLVVHLGAERFAVLLSHDPRTSTRRLVERMLAVFDVPWARGDRSQRLVVSAGLATVERDSAVQSLSDSELALQTARTGGRDRLEVFDPRMIELLQQRHETLEHLEQGLAQGQFSLRYQPIVEVGSGRVHAVEALVRWEHPVRGLVGPDDFVPLAEDTGLIVPLGRWVLHEACAQAAQWRASGLPPVRMSVNVSGRQLDDRFVQDVAETLRRTGLPPDALHLEITETVAIGDEQAAFALLDALHRTGVVLSIDDFGTGYSVLGRLRSLPFSYLKIDRSFVSEIRPGSSAPLVTAMLEMAHGVGLQVVAEGVETEAQLAFLRARSCDLAQGYLFASPLGADAVGRLLSGRLLPAGAGGQATVAATVEAAEGRAVLEQLLREVAEATGLDDVHVASSPAGRPRIPGLTQQAQDVLAELGGTGASPVSPSGAGGAFDGRPETSASKSRTWLGAPVVAPDGTVLGTLRGAAHADAADLPDVQALLAMYARLAAERVLRTELVQAERRRVTGRGADLARRAAWLADAEVGVRQSLTVLDGWSRVLQHRQTALDRTDLELAVDGVARSTGMLARRLDRLLAGTHAQSLGGQLRPEPLSLPAQLRALVAGWSGGCELAPGTPDVTVLADPAALAAIVTELLDRASTGGVDDAAVRVSWQRVRAGVELSVVGGGSRRAHPGTPGAPPGSPAAPAPEVARALAEAMGGALLARGDRGRGASFGLWLPVADGPDADDRWC